MLNPFDSPMTTISSYFLIIITLFMLGMSGQTLANNTECEHNNDMSSTLIDSDDMHCCNEGSCSMAHCITIAPPLNAVLISVNETLAGVSFVYNNAHLSLYATPLHRPPIQYYL